MSDMPKRIWAAIPQEYFFSQKWFDTPDFPAVSYEYIRADIRAAEVDRLREIEAHAINTARAFATGSDAEKQRAFRDLIKALGDKQ